MSGPPSGTVWIDPDEGYLPHFTSTFLDLYGEHSVFVTAAADCLSERHTDALIRAGRLPEDSKGLRRGSQEALDALIALMRAARVRGAEKLVVLLMQSAMGHRDADAFAAMVDDTFAKDIFERWREAIDRGDFSSATALIGGNS